MWRMRWLRSKKVVFEERKYTMAELIDALDHNYEGYEGLLHQLEKSA